MVSEVDPAQRSPEIAGKDAVYVFPEEAVRAGLSQLRERVDVTPSSLGEASQPKLDLKYLSRLWGLAGADEGLPGEPDSGQAMGPAAISMLAARLGLDVTCEQRRPLRLQTSDLPCIVLLSDNTSRLVEAIGSDGKLRIGSRAGSFGIEAPVLDRSANGTIFHVRRRSSDVGTHPDGTHGAPVQPNAATRLSLNRPAKLVMGHLAGTLRAQTGPVSHLVIASILINLFGLTLPLFTMAVFDKVIPHSAYETLWALAIGVATALALELILRHSRLKLFDAIGHRAGLDLQGQAMSRLLTARSTSLPQTSGAAVQPLQELDALAMMAPQLLVMALVDIPFFILLILLISSIAGPIALVPLLGTVFLIALHGIAHFLCRQNSMAQGGLARRLQQMVIDSVTAQERIRITGSAERFLAKWEKVSDEAGYAGHQTRYWHGIAGQGSAVIIQLVTVATIIFGVFQIDAAAMTLGALSATILLVNRAMMPVSIVTGLGFRMAQMLKASGPLAMLLQAQPEAAGDQAHGSPGTIKGQIDLHQVVCSYPGEARAAINGISLSIKPGERVGIIGRAGCGKTTLLRLLARLQDIDQGTLLLDERDIRQFDPAIVRQAIAYMPQDTKLIDGSLDENLTMGLQQVSQDHFDQTVKLAGVHDFASRHPSGYSMQVGPGGERLSGGERQCVSLARTLMGRPHILMLDEPTAALDTTLETRLISNLRSAMGDTGMIIATHRLPILELVERIIWLEGGKIVADGPKAEVFQRFGLIQPAATRMQS